MDVASAKAGIRRLIEDEYSAGFPLLRRIPSTFIWKSLAHMDALGAEERDQLFDVLAERSCGWLQKAADVGPSVERHQELVRHPAYERYVRTAAAPWKYADP